MSDVLGPWAMNLVAVSVDPIGNLGCVWRSIEVAFFRLKTLAGSFPSSGTACAPVLHSHWLSIHTRLE